MDLYINSLDLTAGDKSYVKKIAGSSGNQIAMITALTLWKECEPWNATFKAIIDIMLSLKKGSDARKVFQYLAGE